MKQNYHDNHDKLNKKRRHHRLWDVTYRKNGIFVQIQRHKYAQITKCLKSLSIQNIIFVYLLNIFYLYFPKQYYSTQSKSIKTKTNINNNFYSKESCNITECILMGERRPMYPKTFEAQ